MKQSRPVRPVRSIAAATVLIALAAAALPAPAIVQHPTTVVLPARPVGATTPAAASKTWHAVPFGPHTIYGTIAALRGSQLTLRLRNGRYFPVDASTAIASGSYSAPLFVGKLVTVDGALQNGKYVAAHIIRLTNLEDLPVDR